MVSISLALLLAVHILAILHTYRAALIIEPNHLTVRYDENNYPSNNVTLSCQPLQDYPVLGVTFIQLLRYPPGQQTVIRVAYLAPQINGNFPMRGDGLQERKFTLSGSINTENPYSSLLRVKLNDASCVDEGHYECQINTVQDGGATTEVVKLAGELTTTAPPDRVFLSQTPAFDSFHVDQVVELHCSGQVGSPPAYFRWFYRNTGVGAKPESAFEALTFGVLHNDGPYPQGFCKYFRRSVLWLRADMTLDGVEIQCVLARDATVFYNSSASFTLKVREMSCLSGCLNNGLCVNQTCHCLPLYTGQFCEHGEFCQHAVPLACVTDCDTASDSIRICMTTVAPCVAMALILAHYIWLQYSR